jgi:hypothetical protein
VITDRRVWDAVWQRFHDQAVARRLSPAAAIAYADERMRHHRHGDRPVETQPEETQK